MSQAFGEQSHITTDIHSKDYYMGAGNSKHSSWQ